MTYAEAIICERLADAFFGTGERVRISEKRLAWRLSIAPSPDDEISGDADTVEEVGRILTGRELTQCACCLDLHFDDDVIATDTPNGTSCFCAKCRGAE